MFVSSIVVVMAASVVHHGEVIVIFSVGQPLVDIGRFCKTGGFVI